MDFNLLLNPRQMAELDRRTIEEIGVPALVLMESAAWACAELVLERYSERLGSGVVVLCGPGNNGGDGLAIARRLSILGVPVEVVVLQPAGGLTGDAGIQLDIARRLELEIQPVDLAGGQLSGSSCWSSRGVLVDALFGTGLCRPVTGVAAEVVEAMATARGAGVPVLAVDIPSGVDGGSGRPLGAAVDADLTVSFAAAKTGHFQEPGRSLRGELVVADIGIPIARWPEVTSDAVRLLTATSLQQALAQGPADGHKGTFGHVLVVAGGPGKCGAARLCAEAALRAGAGLVTLAVPASLPDDSLHELCPEVMVVRVQGDSAGAFSAQSLPELLQLIEARDALAIGPGIGTDEGTCAMVVGLWGAASCPAVFDADALNCLAAADLGEHSPAAARVLTPHPGELRRLLGRQDSDPVAERLEDARAVALRYGAVTVLKGAGTVVADLQGDCSIGSTGNVGMATAGSGDVLTGVVAALLGRGLLPEDAASAAVYWHGLAGDIAAESFGQPSLLAGDITKALAAAWKSTLESQ